MRHHLRARPILLATATLLLAACGDRPGSPLAPDAALSVSAGRPVDVPPTALRPDLLVSAEWLERSIARPNVAVLHFGTQAGYDAGHVPGARFVNLAALQPTQNGIALMLREPSELRAALEAAGVSTSSHVVVYGDDFVQGARGFLILEYVGHPRVSLLDGGIVAWKAGNRPVSTEPVAPAGGFMAPPPREQRVVTASWVLDHLHDDAVTLIDARPLAQYAGLVAPTAALPRLGHIPGAHSLFWQQLIVSPADPRLKDPESLRALFAPTGARAGSTVVAYCFSGMLSSVAYFAARYLGYDARLYDGSMFEWSPNAELPIANCGTPWC